MVGHRSTGHPQGRSSKIRCRFKLTTDSSHDLPLAPNLIVPQLTVNVPDKVCVGVVTHIAIDRPCLSVTLVCEKSIPSLAVLLRLLNRPP